MKFIIRFEVSRKGKNIESKAWGELTASNFEEMAEEIRRWLKQENGKAIITEVEEL